MDVATWVDLISGPAGGFGILVLIVVGVVRGWWYPGAAYRKLEADRDEWKDMALRSIQATDKVVTLASDQ